MLYKFRALDCFAYLCTWSSCPGVIVICPLVFLTTSLLVEYKCKVEPFDLGVSFPIRETVGKHLKQYSRGIFF